MPSPINDEILEQAAHWYVTLQDEQCTDEERQKWQKWLSEHTDHEKAWKIVEQIHGEFSSLHQLAQHDHEKDAITQSLMTEHKINRRDLFGIVGILFLGGAIGFQQRETIYIGYLRTRGSEYTSLGVQQHLTSPSGFEYWLNTQTIIRQSSDFAIELLLGEIFIKANAPLRQALHISSHQVNLSSEQAQFGIRQQGNHVILAVLYGTVKLLNQSGQHIVLKAGQQIRATAHTLGAVQTLQTYQYSWIKGILAADNMPLQQWADEMQRYHDQKIKISADASQYRVVGLFPVNDLPQALAMLSNVLPVRSQTSGWNGILIDTVQP